MKGRQPACHARQGPLQIAIRPRIAHFVHLAGIAVKMHPQYAFNALLASSRLLSERPIAARASPELSHSEMRRRAVYVQRGPFRQLQISPLAIHVVLDSSAVQ